ncbi:MAG: TVP38/TMEM64 family protein, partial [Alphaproteobacteria bacterium]
VPVEDENGGRKSAWRRLWPIAALLVAVLLLAVFGPDNQMIFAMLREHRASLHALVADHAVMAVVAFMAIYALAIAFSGPGGSMMTLVGGFLFGPLWTTIYVVFAATVGATVLFLVARSAVGDRPRSRAGPWIAKMESGFQDNAMSYLLVLRLVPLFPFFVVNLVPALLGVPLRTYVVGTFFGIIPGTFVFALAGAGLGKVLDASGDFDVAMVLTPEIVAALAGLAVLALVPVGYKTYQARKAPPDND